MTEAETSVASFNQTGSHLLPNPLQKSCLIAAELKHGPKQVIFIEVDTQRSGNVQAMGALQKVGLCLRRTQVENVLRSFALD